MDVSQCQVFKTVQQVCFRLGQTCIKQACLCSFNKLGPVVVRSLA